MVYSSTILDNTIQAQDVSVQTISPRAVTIKYNNTDIGKICGPTPFVDISTNVENNQLGLPESCSTRITLTGKLVRPQNDTPTGSGITHVLSGIKELRDALNLQEGSDISDKLGLFEITCGTTTPAQIYSATGVKVVTFDVSKTSDNWIQTADISIVLEHNRSLINSFSVKNIVDSWSIEPLEEYVYTQNTITNILTKTENDNPNVKPAVGTNSNPQTGGPAGGAGGSSPNSPQNLDIVSIPLFKVTRNVSAVGIPSGTGTGLLNSTYLNAKKWVDDRLSISLTNTSLSGLVKTTTPVLPNSTYLYNHVRSTSFNIFEGKYEVVDNWLAMPTGMAFYEDYTIEMNTDDKYIHTVSVKGEIRGLSLPTQQSLNSGNVYISGDPTLQINIPLIDASGGSLSSSSVPKILDSITNSSSYTTMSNTKYINAISGWIYDVKPYLYRRASVAMNSADRTKGYIAPYASIGSQSPPHNPIYSRHGLLNIIPVATSESHNTRKGVISYSYDFNNKFTIITGVISENIQIEDSGPTDVIGEAFVLGRALGPVLQNLGTKTASTKSVTVEVSVVPPSSLKGFFIQNSDCPLWTGGTIYKDINTIVSGLQPFGDRPTAFFGSSPVNRSLGLTNVAGQVYTKADNQTWEPTNGRYVRSVTWVYQQCSNNKDWKDH